MITIFTPTYNRAYILPKLYNSLCKQTSKSFEWVLVDDGSTDDTEVLAKHWTEERKINMRYFKQKNLGKPIAHNRGVKEAKGDLFACVDSDDYLIDSAVADIEEIWKIENKPHRTGIIAFKGYKNGKELTRLDDQSVIESTLRDAYKKHGLYGDTMLIFKTDVVKKFHFVVADGEKFIPETYLYNQIDEVGEMYIYRKILYICDYHEDGLTVNVEKNLYNNYKSYVIYINSRLESSESFFDKLKDTIRYEAIMIAHKENKIIRRAIYPWMAVIVWLPSYVWAIKRYGRIMK